MEKGKMEVKKSREEQKIIKIGLVGHSFCALNFGVGVLAAGEMYCIEEALKEENFNFEVTCFEALIQNPYSLNGYLDKVKLEQFNLKNILETKKKFQKMDIIIDATGGDSFSDIYGAKLFVIQMFIKTAILLSRKKYILAPQTYGPFNRKWVALFANYYVNRAEAVFSRDNISSACLNIRNQEKIQKVTDLGFSMQYNKMPNRERFTVGFNISGLLYQSDKLVGQNLNYKELCDKIIITLKSRNIDILLVPHVVGKTEKGIDNDYWVCKELAEKYDVEFADSYNDPVEAKSYISQCNFFIGSRMHATIAAVSSGVPTIPLAYSRKFMGVFEAIEYPYTVDLNIKSEQEIMEQINRGLDNYSEMGYEIEKSMVIAKEKTKHYIALLRDAFINIESEM